MAQIDFERIQSVERTCDLLEVLRELDGATVTEVAETAGIAKSSVYNHLQTLVDNGYVTQDGTTYRIGLKWLDLAGFERDHHVLYRAGRNATARLAERTRQLAALTTHNLGKSVYLYQVRGDDAVNYGSHLGVRMHMHTSAAGKAMLAEMDATDRERVIEEHGLPELTGQTITDRAALNRELSQIREQGYAIDDEERMVGMRGVAAPIISDADGQLLGALAIGGSSVNITDDRLEDGFTTMVREHARIIEISASYS